MRRALLLSRFRENRHFPSSLNSPSLSLLAVVMATRIANVASKIVLPQPLLVKVTYERCAAHTKAKLSTLHALGLRHLHQSKIHKNIRPIRGMINNVRSCVNWHITIATFRSQTGC